MKIKWIPRGAKNLASSRIRVYFIDQELKRRGIESGFEEITNPDIIIFQKPKGKEIINICKIDRKKTKVIIDTSDAQNIAEVLKYKECSDIITTETTGRAKEYKKFGIDTVVIPGCIDYVINSIIRKHHQMSSMIAYAWFGYNMNLNRDIIEKLDISITAFCETGKGLPKNCIFKKWKYNTFLEEIKDFDIALLPRHPIEDVNKKAPNKFNTAVSLGLVPIVGDIPSYREILERVNCEELICNNIDDWKRAINMLDSVEVRNQYLDKLQPYVWENFNVKKITDVWVDLFKDALNQ